MDSFRYLDTKLEAKFAPATIFPNKKKTKTKGFPVLGLFFAVACKCL